MILQQKQPEPVTGNTVTTIPISRVVADLRRRGYRYKFRREADCIYCIELGSWFLPDDFKVDEYYYFEDRVNTHGDRMLYAIASIHGLKGFLVDTSFVYAGSSDIEMTEIHELEFAPEVYGAF